MTEVPEDVRSPVASEVPSAPAELTVPVDQPRPGVLVLRPVGEIDLATAARFRQAVLDRLTAASPCVVLDLDGLDFMGSRGVAVLHDAHLRADELGVQFVVTGGRRPVLRALEVTGLDAVLDARPSVPHALGEVPSAAEDSRI